MAAKWQQWMPRHIDRWRGSPAVRAMHPAARDGYWELLCCQWQSEDCSLSSDSLELAEKSGLGDELWATHSLRILRNFEVLESGRLRNKVCFDEWTEAKRIFEARQEAAKNTTKVRSPRKKRTVTVSKTDGQPTVTDASPQRSPDTITGTLTTTNTEENQKQKPSRRAASSDGMKHSSDPRHMGCKDQIFAAYRHVNGGANPPWDGREGQALGMLLKALPELTTESIRPLLAHWARSDVNHGDRPSIWIPKLSSFRIGPIDRFNKPKEAGNGQQRTGKGHSIVEAAESAIRDLAGEATGNFGDGEAGQRRFGDVEVLRPQPLGLPAAGSAQRDRPTLPYEAAGRRNGLS